MSVSQSLLVTSLPTAQSAAASTDRRATSYGIRSLRHKQEEEEGKEGKKCGGKGVIPAGFSLWPTHPSTRSCSTLNQRPTKAQRDRHFSMEQSLGRVDDGW